MRSCLVYVSSRETPSFEVSTPRWRLQRRQIAHGLSQSASELEYETVTGSLLCSKHEQYGEFVVEVAFAEHLARVSQCNVDPWQGTGD